MTTPVYVELQVTTNFSFLRGAAHPEEFAARAAALGQPAIAVTDRNTLAGVVRAHLGAKAAGIRAIVGARLDFADDTPSLLCLPEDRAAYGRLSRLLTLGKRRAEKGECRLVRGDLTAPDGVFARGRGQVLIIVPPEDPDETFARALKGLRDDLESSPHLAASHRYAGDDARRLARLAALAEAAGTPLVATNDAHYHVPARRALADVVTCIREHRTIDEAGFRLAANAERHLKPAEEMARLFRDHPDAVARTAKIAARCRFSLDELRYEYPAEPVPEGMTADEALADLAWAGAAERYPAGVPEKVAKTIRHELALIAELRYAPYFLTVHDLVRFARSQGILCQGRGSAANSAVCYCLGVTAVDPARIELLFERFISGERNEPPDIDVDFEHERREEVIQYIYAKYGRERAGLAATVISYRARSALREVGKALGLSEDTVAALSGQVWGWSSEGLPEEVVRSLGLDPGEGRLALALRLTAELIGFPRHLSQHVGGFVIARGRLDELVPIENAAMENRTVIEWDKDDLDALGMLKIDVLALGMLTCVRKGLDLLAAHHGRRLELAEVPAEDPAVYDMLCKGDSIGVFQVESRAQIAFLPRMKPRSFYDLVIEVAIVRPGPIQGDMVHPYLRRRNGEEPVAYPSPELEAVLGRTLGVPLFQEQVMQIAIVAAGFTPGEADRLRRAMATFRKTGTINTFRERMVGGMLARGYGEDFAERCFRQIEGFAEYGFPESHAASFALLVYVSAWLKCHYPDVFAAALLNSQPMGFYAPAQIVRDASEHGVPVRGPDVNASDRDNTLEIPSAPPRPSRRRGACPRTARSAEPWAPPQSTAGNSLSGTEQASCFDRLSMRQKKNLVLSLSKDEVSARIAGNANFRPDTQNEVRSRKLHPEEPASAGVSKDEAPATSCTLRLGFRQVKALSGDAARAIVAARPAGGYTSVEEVWRRAGVNTAALVALAEADGFASLGLARREALWAIRALGHDGGETAAALPLFAAAARAGTARPEAGGPVALPAETPGEAVVNDYTAIRMSLKDHPLALLRAEMDRHGALPAGRLVERPDGSAVVVAGVVLVRQRPGGSGVIFMTLEDETGVANVVVWPALFRRFRREVMAARLVRVHGRLQREGIVTHVVAKRIVDMTAQLHALADGEPLDPRDPGAPKRHPPPPSLARHPRNERPLDIKSRDFH